MKNKFELQEPMYINGKRRDVNFQWLDKNSGNYMMSRRQNWHYFIFVVLSNGGIMPSVISMTNTFTQFPSPYFYYMYIVWWSKCSVILLKPVNRFWRYSVKKKQIKKHILFICGRIHRMTEWHNHGGLTCWKQYDPPPNFVCRGIQMFLLSKASLQYVSSGFRCRVITGSLMRLY